MRRLILIAGLSLGLFTAGWVGFRGTLPERVEGVFRQDPATPYIRLLPASSRVAARGATMLIVHGLDSNKEFMQLLAMAMTDAGFETWTIDLPGHGDSGHTFDSETSLQTIGTALDSLPADTVVLGHSLGAALVADLAMTREIGDAILISPPPIPLAPIRIGRLLVITGRFDAPRINPSIPALLEATLGNTEWLRFDWAGHSTALYNPVQMNAIVEWTLGERVGLQALERLLWLALMTLGALLIPAGSVWLYLRRRERPGIRDTPEISGASDLVGRVGALAASLVMLAFVNPVSGLRLFRTDYLLGVILISGLALSIWIRLSRGRVGVPLSLRGALAGVGGAAGLLLMVVLAGSSIAHLVPSGEQWLRFPVIAAVCLPLALYDERVLRPYRSWWRRWGLFLLSRVLIWAAVMTGVLLLNREAVFLVLITHLIMLGWFPLWWAAGLVGRATGEAGAAALFSSLVQGWVLAALFVTI